MVLQGSCFLGFIVVLYVGLARFVYDLVGFRVFQCLVVFSGKGICQGQLHLCKVDAFAQGWDIFIAQCLLGFRTVVQGFCFFSVQRSFLVRVYPGVSLGCVGLRFFMVWSSFASRGCQFCLRFGRVYGFQRLEVFSGQGMCQGQLRFCRVEVFFKFRVVSRLGLAWFACGFLGLMVFLCLEVFSGQGICQGQLWLCLGFRFFRVWSRFAPRVGQVFLRLGRVQGFSAVRGILRLGYILGLVTIVQGLGFLGFRVVSC